MGPQLLCSTGVISRDPDMTDHRTILDRIGSIEATEFELIYYEDWYENSATIRDELALSDVKFPVLHAEKSIGPLLGASDTENRKLALNRLGANCEVAVSVGAKLMVLHLWGFPDSDMALERNLESLPACADICEHHGVELSIETIPCVMNSPVENIERALIREPRISVTLDTEFLAMHGQIELAMETESLWRSGVVKHIHIKDYDGCLVDSNQRRRYLHPGEGSMAFDDLFARLHARRYQGTFSLESSALNHAGLVDFAKANRSLRTIAAHLAEWGGDSQAEVSSS